jgi:transposase
MIANLENLREVLNEEKEPEVRWKLSFINLVAGGMVVKEVTAYFGIGIATGYKWIRRWNSEGKEGLRRRKIPGRPPKLSEKELKELKRILKAKPYWRVKEVMKLVKELFGVNYSGEQIRRILVERLGMNYAKPFVGDYRRPKDAEDILAERMEGAIKNLKHKSHQDEDRVIGFLDEASPQNQANTVRVLSFGKPRTSKKYGQNES